MTQRTVLVVDDDENVLRLLAGILEREGYHTLRAASPQQALITAAAAERIDLLLTDVQMPGAINGITLAVILTNERPDMAVIFMSGAATPQELDKLDAQEFAYIYLHKPFTISTLVEAVEGSLAGADGDEGGESDRRADAKTNGV